jgi:predicted CXXCH cytochrome family protein
VRAAGCLTWAILSIACGSPAPPRAPAAARGGSVASNVLRGDYAGSEACADCHSQIFERWRASPMRNMTRDATAAATVIRAPFDGATLHVGADTATMEMDGGARVMRVESPGGTERFRITKVIGGRYREDFVGVDVRGGLERVLPATYVFSTRSWRYKGYSVMVKERPAMSSNGVWSRECIACHNTLPLATTLYDELYGPDLPGYQGKLSSRLLPASRLWNAAPRDEGALARALSDEIRFLGGTPPEGAGWRALLPVAATTSEERLDGTKLVELGIGCEACHNGAREHAAHPERLPSYEARGTVLGVSPPRGQSGTRAQWINQTCAKCHTVLFSRYPWTWEGGTRRRNLGGSTTNSGEGRDFQLGGCASAMACTTCHDPHTEDPPARLAKLATVEGNGVCATCHPTIARELAAHTHHDPAGAGSACIGCHMPKKNMGLDYGLVRYHRIGSPNDPARIAGDRPLECAVCHADKSVEQLAASMEAWWGKPLDRAALRRLYGDDLGAGVLPATLRRGKPHEQAAAIVVLGEARDASQVPAIAAQLSHEYPLVRYFALRALERITGAPVPIDVGAPAAEVRAAAQRWLAARATAAAARP